MLFKIIRNMRYVARRIEINEKAFNPNLHNPDDGAAVAGEIPHGRDDIRGVEERLRVGREEHEQARGRHVRSRYGAGDGEPQEGVSGEALGGAGGEDDPRAAWGGGVEEAG
ncbi:actin monomer binding protein [Striga asiatica]|uniref:Actin monomer binding protein n=1 Tax=Striga asiatica TaxID=4170 RepID=A0A5A7R773_STRAF|nr:actin monomer binding protein [Striga asiatica]